MNIAVDDVIKIRLGTALVSLFLSVFLIYSDDIINSDGILYMDMAEAFIHGGLIQTAKLYDWPFFSIFIAYLHQLTSLSFETSASVLNTILAVLLTDTLLLISNKFLPNTRQLAVAALLIVSFYTLNDYRDYIIRDFGYWAFCSLTLYRFILYLESSSVRNSTLWQLCALIAIFFRIEGLFVLFALPLYLFFVHQPLLATKKMIRLNYLFIIGGLVGTIAAISNMKELSVDAFGKILSMTHYIDMQNTFTQIGSRADILSTQILHPYAGEYGILILVSGLFSMLIFKLVKAISFGYLAIFVSSFWRDADINTDNKYLNLLTYFALIHIFILVTFILTMYFVSTRYAMMAILTLLLLMLPRMTSWISEAWASRKITRLIFIGLALLISITDVMTSSVSKIYIQNAAIWASSNISYHSSILTGDAFSHYYLKKHSRNNNIKLAKHRQAKGNDYLTNKYQNYDYLLTLEKRKDTELRLALKQMNLELIHCERNKRKDKSCVYKVMHNE